MRAGTVGRLLFVFYCVEAGVFLLLAPWSPIWDRVLAAVPIGGLYPFVLKPIVRAAVSAFGVVHLVWGAHDLELWLEERAAARRSS